MNIKLGAMEEYQSFSLFQSLKEFHLHMEKLLLECKRDFSKGELIGLKMLVRCTDEIPGVCHASIGKMVEMIHEEDQASGISRDTFKCMIKKAKVLGILTVYETVRENGSQSCNLYVFHRNPNVAKENTVEHF
jgi:hypothetical protein